MSDETLGRRDFAGRLLRGGVALAVLPACGVEAAVITDCPALPDSREGWVEVRLDEHPPLREPGGASVVTLSQALLDVVVLHQPEGCYTALWRGCTHGACEVEYRADRRLLECPCHGSLFDEAGAVVRGPATRGLRRFAVTRAGESLWIHRPL